MDCHGLFLRMLGMGLVMMPLATAGINALPQTLISHGTAANNTVRQIFASLGSAIIVGVMSTSVSQYISHHGMNQAPHPLFEATIKGLNNGFLAAFILTILAFIFCFLLNSLLRIMRNDFCHSVKGNAYSSYLVVSFPEMFL